MLSNVLRSQPYQQENYSEGEAAGARPASRIAPDDLDPRVVNAEDRYLDPSLTGRPSRELLPSSLARSPPYYRSSTLPPASRGGKAPRSSAKASVAQNARRPKHNRTRSKDHARRTSYERKAMSAEPQAAAALNDKRWKDLIDAAASATEEDSRDLTPVGLLQQDRSFLLILADATISKNAK